MLITETPSVFENLFLSLGDTGVGLFLAGSTASFAAVESLHLLGLALLGGAALVTDLTVLRVVFRRADPARIAAALFPLLLIGLSIMVVSGVLLVSAGPLKYWLNPLFGPKLLALLFAVVAQFLLYPVVLKWNVQKSANLSKVIAAASILIWFTVAVIGRWVGLI